MKKQTNYKFQRIRINIRWVDYQRIRQIFPAEKNESAADYFIRFAKWLKENYGK